MRNLMLIALLALCARSWAASYYVSSSSGSDANNGTSASTPWQTLGAHVNGGTFSPGDVIYLKRGDRWNEQLVPPSSGNSGSPISFDTYGTGAAPIITAAAPIPFVSGSWTYISGSTWKATIASTITSPTVNMVQFGNLYGRKRPYGSGCASSITSKYDWCLSWPYLYIYSPSGINPTSTYASDGSIVPVVAQAAGLSMISIAGKNWLTFQHIKIQAFDYIGVGISGASDNLVFANMEVDGIVPFGATPLGFYVNATNPANIQFLNDEGLFGGKSGADKKDAAMSFLESALATVDAVAQREIVDPKKFKNGVSKIIDGTVDCLNASTWAKEKSPVPAVTR